MKRLQIALFALVLIASFIKPSSVLAQASSFGTAQAGAGATSNWKLQTIFEYAKAIYEGDDMNLQAHIKSTFDTFAYVFTDAGTGSACVMGGGDAEKCIKGSFAGQMNSAIASMYANPPADTGLWIADTGHSLGFIPTKVYAQGKGIGFSGLAPLLPIWKAFRNIAYLLMAIVMMVLGFMIMFRKKIDPKTVVTAQNAIPRVVIALILITFSYAIVGIMIDVMYLLIYFAIALFGTTNLLPTDINGKTVSQFFSQSGLYDLFSSSLGSFDPYKLLFGVNMGGGAAAAWTNVGISVIALGATLAGGPLVGGGLAVAALPYASMPLIHLIVTIALIFLFIRLLAFFLMTYVQIIISLIFAPLQLLAEAFPGSEAFSSWFKNLAANLAVFPIAAVMFMLAMVFTKFSDASGVGVQDTTAFWAPPFVSLNLHWLWGAIDTNSNNMTAISALLSLGILFAIPSVAGSIKELLKAKPAVSMFDMQGAGGSAMNMLSMAYYFKQLVPKLPIGNKEGGGGGGHGDH